MSAGNGRVRVLFAIPTMDVLGTQRILTWVLKGLDRNKYEPVLLLHERRGEFLQEVPPDVQIEDLGTRFDRFIPTRFRLLTWAYAYRRKLNLLRPDVAFGMSEYPTLAMAAATRGASWPVRIIATQHAFMSRAMLDPSSYTFLFRHYFKRVFQPVYNRDCKFVTTETRAAADDLIKNWGIREDKLRVVPNPIDSDMVEAVGRAPVSHQWLQGDRRVVMGVGRLVQQKRFDRLIDAFAAVSDRDAVLMIIGHGPLQGQLERQAKALGLEGRFEIVSRTPSYDFVSRASVFALTSDWEGFGMVILDAMVLGVPVVSVACPAGPPELLDGGRLGSLVEEDNAAALSDALEEALGRGPAIMAKADLARRATSKFSVDAICAEYDVLITEAMQGA